MANDDWTEKPFASWLEDTIRELVKANPVAIAMEMVDETGLVSTCYYDTSPNDRACMIDAMRDDARWEFIRDNREEILALLNDEDDDEDELQDADTETDCEDG
jgi:hypothetical protein